MGHSLTDNSGITIYGLMALGRETSYRSMAHFTFFSDWAVFTGYAISDL